MSTLAVLAAVFLGGGLYFLLHAGARIRRLRLARASGNGLLAVAFLGAGAGLGGTGAALQTYHRLSAENLAADITLRQLAPQRYQATIAYADTNQAEQVELRGDEWQLDARILKFHPAANVLGVDTLFVLERVSGRYSDIQQQRNGPHSAHELHPRGDTDLWTVAAKYPRWLPWVDAVYGNAAYLPMQDGASYQVLVSSSGLVARPGNDVAEAAVKAWR